MPYSDHFRQNQASEWKSYGGSWHLIDGAIRNDSDDRGAKLITGSSDLSDYQTDADVQLTSSFGDAGIVFRVTAPEEGANAFYGYYAGIRLPGELIVGKVDLGFRPLASVRLQGGALPNVWYHLRARAIGCYISVEATELEHGRSLGQVALPDAGCYRRGGFGLRSYESGGLWRNVRVSAVQ